MSELKETILANIDKFPVSEFCTDGGWPNFDNLQVLVLKEEEVETGMVYDIELAYDCEFAGCCFIPGGENYTRLRKKVKVSKKSFQVLS